MSYVTSEDIRSLRADLNSLGDDIGDRVRTAADKGWSGAMDSAQSIVDEIEEHPRIATLLALMGGIMIGMVIGTTRAALRR